MAEDVLALFEASVADLILEEPTVHAKNLQPTSFQDEFTEVNLDLEGALEALIEEERPAPKPRRWSFSDLVVADEGPVPVGFSKVGPPTVRQRPPASMVARRRGNSVPAPRNVDPDDDLPEIDSSELVELPPVDDLAMPKVPLRVVVGKPVRPGPRTRPRRTTSVLLLLAVTMLGAWAIVENADLRMLLPL